MMRVSGVLALAFAGVAAAPAAATELTPDGPATLMNRWTGAATSEGRPPGVLVGVRVTVGAGGREGPVRVRARSSSAAASVAGEPVVLPATPGTYDFAAPHVSFDTRSGNLGLDQTIGGHAIVEASPCRPELGQWADLCQLQWLDSSPAGTDAPTQSRGGAKLAIAPVVEVDLDEDLLGDKSEDRTDLRVRSTTTRADDDRLHTDIVVTNAGPLDANLLTLELKRMRGVDARWEHTCSSGAPMRFYGADHCAVGALAADASRTFKLVSDDPRGRELTVSARSEGEDLAPADNTITVDGAASVPGAPRAATTTVKAARTLTLRTGLKVTLRGEGRTRVTAAFRVSGRTLRLSRTVTLVAGAERTVTLRAQGAKLRTLRRAAARGPLRVTITARDANGSASTTARVR